MSSKKITGYSRDFKLKVLEYYFKHGGDKKFGLKTKTAHHFCIDHKTVSRMLCKPDIVQKARRILTKKSSSDCKSPTLRSEEQSYDEPTNNLSETVEEDLPQISPPGPSRSSHLSDNRTMPSVDSEVPVIELPEDPDFSLLKRTIESSASSSANFARLLITGTNEVKRIMVNECELIFECRVCRNLFRSVVNFLAHKRVYCQEEFANVKSLFHKDSGLKMTNESSTVIVEPEPPPCDMEETGSETQQGKSELIIDQIASRLARNKKKESGENTDGVSSSIHKGSSSYFNRLQEVNGNRKSMNNNCSVLLQDIAGVNTAVYQTFIPPISSKPPRERPQRAVREVHQRKREQPVQLDSEGKVVKRKEMKLAPSPSITSPVKEVKEPEERIFMCRSCPSSFSSQILLNSHVEEIHGIERCVYTCPICNMIFLTIWGCVKHLIRVHKKKKHQRERLKHVICSRAYSKVFTRKDMAKLTHKSYSSTLQKKEVTSSSPVPPKEAVKEGLTSRLNLPQEEDAPPTFNKNKTSSLPHSCPRCGQSFQTPTERSSHLQYCSLASLQGNYQSETPEKKIAIQIRKDYKKESIGPPVVVKGISPDMKTSLAIQSRMKEICLIDRLYCIPCKKRYHTITILKRHVAQHIGWTRFSCTRCSFRSYEKYMSVQHCLTEHRATDKNVEQMYRKEEKLGTLKYHLPTANKSVKNNSEASSKVDQEYEKKMDFLHNGDCSSPSECSASVISEDSSLKGEFENQDLEIANVAYRELIENVDIAKDIKDTPNEYREESQGRKDSDLKMERPQRTRKTVEQKDFVYEPLRSTSSNSSRSGDDDKLSVVGIQSTRRRVSVSVVSEGERSSKRKCSSPNRELKKIDARTSPSRSVVKICNGNEDASEGNFSTTDSASLKNEDKEPAATQPASSPEQQGIKHEECQKEKEDNLERKSSSEHPKEGESSVTVKEEPLLTEERRETRRSILEKGSCQSNTETKVVSKIPKNIEDIVDNNSRVDVSVKEEKSSSQNTEELSKDKEKNFKRLKEDSSEGKS